MKVEEPKSSFVDEASIISELEILLKQPDMNELRPCRSCDIKCESCNSTLCGCTCSANCADIPQAMSIDPERYPIEPGIAKLVFELNSLRLFQTCWSCEGHLSRNGAVNKLPRIWFYSPSPIYPQLIVQHISELSCAHKLNYKWGVQMISWNGELYCTYSLEPVMDFTTELDIALLHSDLQIISQNFADNIRVLARNYLRQLNQKKSTARFGDR